MKCAMCNNKVERHFLGKLLGTVVYKDGKKVVCSACQRVHKDDVKEQL